MKLNKNISFKSKFYFKKLTKKVKYKIIKKKKKLYGYFKPHHNDIKQVKIQIKDYRHILALEQGLSFNFYSKLRVIPKSRMPSRTESLNQLNSLSMYSMLMSIFLFKREVNSYKINHIFEHLFYANFFIHIKLRDKLVQNS